MKYLNYLLAASLLILIGCSKEELTNSTSTNPVQTESNKKGKSVTKSFSGTITYTTDYGAGGCQCPSNTGPGPLFTGSGNISHMGNSSATVASCVDLSNLGIGVIGIVESCATLMAANGDEIYLSPQSYDLVFNPATSSFEGNSVVDVIGGTGRFVNALGYFDVFVSQDLNDVVTSTWSGSVAY